MTAITLFITCTLLSLVATRSATALKCTTPQDYIDRVRNKELCEVNTCLYGRVITYNGPGAGTLAHKDTSYAWVSGSELLKKLLIIRNDAMLNDTTRREDVRNLLGIGELKDYAQYYVFDGCKHPERDNVSDNDFYRRYLNIQPPTASIWASILQLEFNITLPQDITENLTGNFSAVTGGCEAKREDGSYNDDFDKVGRNDTMDFNCSTEFLEAWGEYSRDGMRSNTDLVFGHLKKRDPITLPYLRAALWAGQSVNPMNTFDGKSHNGQANVEKSKEYLIRNVPVNNNSLAGLRDFDLLSEFLTLTPTCRTPKEYMDHLDRGQICDVDECLYGHLVKTKEETHITNDASDYAWISDHAFLKSLLENRNDTANVNVTTRELVAILLNEGELDNSARYYVFNACRKPKESDGKFYQKYLDIQIPSLQIWRSILQLSHDVSIPYNLTEELTGGFELATGGCNITNADGEYNAEFEEVGLDNKFSCSDDFLVAWDRFSARGTRHNTTKVIETLKAMEKEVGSYNPSMLRAALWAAYGLNPTMTLKESSQNMTNSTAGDEFPNCIIRNVPLETTRLASLQEIFDNSGSLLQPLSFISTLIAFAMVCLTLF